VILAEAAVAYARRGWRVFPLVPRRKVPLTRHGLHDASRDPGLVGALWAEHPAANVGVACGPSGLLVVDIDGEAAARAWVELAARNGGDPRTLTAATAKGWHCYYEGEGRSTAGRIAPGIDTRGRGGYVVAPPSVHETGALYRWVEPAAAAAPLPSWVAEALRRPPPSPVGEARELPEGAAFTRYGLAALAGIVDEMAATPEGRRNATLNALAFRAGRLVGAGQLAEEVAGRELVAAAVAAGLDAEEAAATFRSGFDAGLLRPVRLEARP
jgi:hypothetical protein